MNITTVLGAIATAILFFFGIIFALAAVYDPIRLVTAVLLLAAGSVLAYLIVARRPTTTIHKLEVSGEMKAVALKCPNCSASIATDHIKMVSGVPYATCPYCGHTFEVTEEPKW